MPEIGPHHLVSLPAEIVIQVTEDLGLIDTWSLAQTSREVYDFCQPAMKRHKENKKKRSTVTLGPPWLAEDGGPDHEGFHSLVFLEQIIQDPRIASYVTHLRISRCHSEPDERDFQGDAFAKEQKKLDTTIAAVWFGLAALGSQCPWLPHSVKEFWQNAFLNHDNQPHYVAILLTMLPDLRSVWSKDFGAMFKPLENLKRFTYEHESAQVGSAEYEGSEILALLRDSFAHSLEHLDLTTDMIGDEEGDHLLEGLQDFAALRSLRVNVTAFSLVTAGEPVDFRLADHLPAAIQQVTLVGWYSNNGPLLLLDKLAEDKDRLPELERLCVEGRYDIPEEHIAACENAGIEVIMSDLSVLAYAT
ncbi:MAG: hypothetical protein Q9168_006278 [Polycauliona sp. 1 TL-2023]